LKHFIIIEHTADIGIKAYGDSMEEAFAAAGEAMFQLMTENAAIQKKTEKHLACESMDREGLLVQFLSNLIVVHEVEGLVFGEFTVRFTGPNSLAAQGWGEAYEPGRHGRGFHIKGVSYNQMEISGQPGKTESFVRVVFDI
jgi:SHS2 domain-containing protein